MFFGPRHVSLTAKLHEYRFRLTCSRFIRSAILKLKEGYLQKGVVPDVHVRQGADLSTTTSSEKQSRRSNGHGRKRNIEEASKGHPAESVNGKVTVESSSVASMRPADANIRMNMSINTNQHLRDGGSFATVPPQPSSATHHAAASALLSRQSSTSSLDSVSSTNQPRALSMNRSPVLFPHDNVDILKSGFDANIIRRTFRTLLYTQYHILNENEQFIKLQKSYPIDSDCAKLIKMYYPNPNISMLARFARLFPLSEQTRREETDAILKVAQSHRDRCSLEEIILILYESNAKLLPTLT